MRSMLFCFGLLLGGCVFAEDQFEVERQSASAEITQLTDGGDLILPTEVHSIDIEGVQVNESFYKPNFDVHWSFNIGNGHYVLFESEKFDLELSENCMFDYLQILEQDDDTKFCGFGQFAYISPAGQLDLHFFSDESYEGRGLKLHYKTLPIDDIAEGQCNSFINGGPDGEISGTSETCFYRIQAPAGLYASLDLDMINFGSRSCEEESIKIYQGVSTQGKLLKTICAGETQGIIDVYEEKLFIEYRRNFESQAESFIIKYKYKQDTRTTTIAPITTPSPLGGDGDCSEIMLGQSEGFQREFPHWENNKHCIFVVRTKPEYVVQVTFETFDMEHEKNCIFDSFKVISGETEVKQGLSMWFRSRLRHLTWNTRRTVYLIPSRLFLEKLKVTFETFDMEHEENCIFDSFKVISGETEDSPALGGPYCGDSLNGKTFITNGNSLRLEFKTDNSFALYGVQAKIDFVSREDCECIDPDKVCVRIGYEKQCMKGSTCNTKQCENGGTCIKTASSEQCYCQQGFSGETCDEQKGNIGYIPFSITPSDNVFKSGSNHAETCSVDTTYLNEEPIIDWTFKGERIGKYTAKEKFGTQSDKFLQLNDIDPKMSGLYSCQVTIGDVFGEIFFTYTVRDECVAQIQKGPDDIAENVGGQVILTCEAYGAERVYWEQNGVELDVENTARFSLLADSYFLLISPLEEGDAGEYACVAVDNEGCTTKHRASLSVTKMEKQSAFCGLSIHDQAIHGRVSMGKASQPGEFPWHVNMINAGGNSFCGASVVSQNYILTAAHCINTHFNQLENVKLIFGSTNCKGSDVSPDNIRRPVEVIKHPAYNQGVAYNNDIAIIKLNKPIKYGRYIRPICLQPAAFYDVWFFEKRTKLTNAVGYVAGCGEGFQTKDDKLMDVRIPYVDKDACSEAYEGELEITDKMFCAGHEQSLRGDTCSGDSGGAVLMTDEKRWYQTGIVSHGKGCDKGFYGIYTDVGEFYNWIKDITHFDTEEVQNFLEG